MGRFGVEDALEMSNVVVGVCLRTAVRSVAVTGVCRSLHTLNTNRINSSARIEDAMFLP